MAIPEFRRYKDIDISLIKNPITRDVVPLYDADAVKRAVKLLILTNYKERPFQPEAGSNVYYQLFENFGLVTKIALNQAIEEVINNFEPRATIEGVTIDDSNIDNNQLIVTVVFSIINILDPVKITFSLERVR
jgi:phage baseplate assembly protein W